jgi:hypothetical protein
MLLFVVLCYCLQFCAVVYNFVMLCAILCNQLKCIKVDFKNCVTSQKSGLRQCSVVRTSNLSIFRVPFIAVI